MQRKPYHLGSICCPPPCQEIDHRQQVEWLDRVRAYWDRPNALAGKVARALLGCLGPDGALFPARETIARIAGCDVKTVGRWIKRMAAVGFLKSIMRFDDFGQDSNAYLILFPSVEDVAPESYPQPCQAALKLPLYREEQDSNLLEEPKESISKDSLPAAASRLGVLRRVQRLLGVNLAGVYPEPQGWEGADSWEQQHANMLRQVKEINSWVT